MEKSRETQKMTMDFTDMCEREFVSEYTFQIDFEVDLGLFSRVESSDLMGKLPKLRKQHMGI